MADVKISELPASGTLTGSEIVPVDQVVGSTLTTVKTTTQDIANLVAGGIRGPQGIQGPTGPQGVPGPIGPAGLTWRGSWTSGTSYVANDTVSYSGASYFCILATSGTTNPITDTTHWALLASQGAQGPAGATGAQGPQGPAGSANLPYKVFTALLTQNGQSGLTITELQNTIGTISVITYGTSGVGPYHYYLTSSALFTSSKTVVFIGTTDATVSTTSVKAYNTSTSIIQIYGYLNGTIDHNVIQAIPIEIRVYLNA